MTKNSHHKKSDSIINISFNIVIPSVVMMKFDDWFALDPTIALILALLFPIGYGLFDFYKARKWNIFSCVGFFSILITGGIGLLKLPSEWIPIKEAAIPTIFCVLILLSLFDKRTILEKFLFNEGLLNAELIYSRVKTDEQKQKFQLAMRVATMVLALSFVISAVLNYILAKLIVHSPTNSPNFTKEIGNMLALSYPVIVLPCTIILYGMLYYVIRRIRSLSGLSTNQILDLE